MAEIKISRVEQGQTKIKNVPIAVTPEGFWCCPSPVVFQKTLKAQNTLNKPKSSSPPAKADSQRKPTSLGEKMSAAGPIRSGAILDDQQTCASDNPGIISTPVVPERASRPKVEHMPRKVAIEFGEPGTSDMKIILFGKQGFCVKLSVHKKMLAEHSRYFADKISEQESRLSCFEINECEDVEIYVETVGLMYCKEMKQRLIKQSVPRVLRILKVAESLKFDSCISSCLEYLEAVPWVGEEEEEKVVSSVLQLQSEGISVNPVLKRVSSEVSHTPKDTISHIVELVLSSSEERGRREMKAIVLKLLKENNNIPSCAGSDEIFNKTIYASCRNSLDSLATLFKKAAELDLTIKSFDNKESVSKQIALQADNLIWLLEILLSRQSGDEYALLWADQKELAILHSKLPTMLRYHVSCITSRIFVGIGKGELLPAKETRQLLLHTWLQPLINDYSWLQHGCRTFERKVVEEGIGRTILTLPLEDQQTILLAWLGSFLKAGDNCPNLQRAFEVWWRRAFVRPYVDSGGHSLQGYSSTASKS